MRNVKPDLRVLLIEITQKCNAKCDHCGSRCDINSGELLSKEDILSALTDIKNNIGTDVMINITGGEPLMRSDLFDITKEITKMGFDWGLVTNGTLITDDVIKSMKETGLKTITISIDGLKETHESLRHMPGSFDIIIRNIKKLKEADFLDHLQVTFTSNKRNVYEFPSLYEILDTLGLDSVRTSCIDMIGRGSDHEELKLGRKELLFITDFINNINEAKRTPIIWGCPHYLGDKLNNREFYCFTGIYAASILYNGDIFACPNVPRRPEFIQGNIKKISFSKAWKDGFEIFRNKKEHEYCRDCRYKDTCGGDSFHSWDYDNDKPSFCYKDIFDKPERYFLKKMKQQYGSLNISVVKSDEIASKVYIEPRAYEELKNLFRFGTRHPLNMYEQQAGLVGYKTGDICVIKYIFEDNGYKRYKDNAMFVKRIMDTARYETDVIKKNFPYSDDKDDYIGEHGKLELLGFAHSHPVQSELRYSIGDELLHKRLVKKLGNYIGILINPKDETIGAYIGKKIIQAELVILEKK